MSDVLYSPFLALQASAGSGKTFSLSLHYLLLLFQEKHPNPHEILALTFTKKAACEMQQKITHALHILSTNSHDISQEQNIYLEGLCAYGNISKGAILKRAPNIYRIFLASKPKIMTFDSLFFSILKKFCWYAHVPYDFEIQNSDELFLLEIFLNSLSMQQKEILLSLCYSERWYHIEDLYHFLEDLLEKNYESPMILKQIKEKHNYDEVKIIQYATAIQEAVLNDKNASQSAKKAVVFTNIADLCSKTWMHKLKLKDFQYFKKLCLENYEHTFTLLKEEIYNYYLHSENNIFLHSASLLKTFIKSLHVWHKQHHALRIKDVMLRTHELLCTKNIDTDFLYFRLDSKITHILIDEFQDTNILQYQILEPIINEIISGYTRKENRSFFMVGDTKQSIYYFRGSNPRLFEYVSGMENIDKASLRYNWRSREEIVFFVNLFFKNVYIPFIEQLPKKNGGYVEVVNADEAGEEYLQQAITSIVAKLLNIGIAQEDIAILAFKNSDIIKIADFLQNSLDGIMVVKEGSISLLDHIEVKALRYALCYIYKKQNIDKIRFFALANQHEKTDFLDDIHTNNPAEIVRDIMRAFELTSDAAKKFLALALPHRNIESFLEYLERNSHNQPEENIKGIRILTLHSSKGLEFPHVIVVDRIGGQRYESDKIIFRYDEHIQAQQMFAVKKNREYFDEAYKVAKQKNKTYQDNESVNLLYVACTRAKDSLFIVKKNVHSSFDILNLPHFYKKGVLQNYIQAKETLKPEEKEFQRVFLYEDFGKTRKQFAIQKDIIMPQRDVFNKFKERGELFHFILEHLLKYQRNLFSLKDIAQMAYNRFGHFFYIHEIYEMIEQCNQNVKSKSFLDFLSKGKVECEVSFLHEGSLYRIDLLVIAQDCIYIVDYKSGNPSKKEYIKQIQNYKKIVSNHYQKQSKGYIITFDFTFIEIE